MTDPNKVKAVVDLIDWYDEFKYVPFYRVFERAWYLKKLVSLIYTLRKEFEIDILECLRQRSLNTWRDARTKSLFSE